MRTGHFALIGAAAGDASLAKIGDALVKTLLGLSAMILACSPTGRVAAAAEGHEFRICSGYFALCAASTCQPTGKKIKVNVPDDGTARIPRS